ncbi:MAG: DNA (cytosine-5-)-methyltransferase [Erythrobacter sp. 34-65-8]|nr:MAG: DNA (cytosine-5-)-methyltransferase [Erythrobacter sp. 34-65-8]
MRKAPTEAERRLWSALRSHRLAGWKFKRQEQIGDYIVDFICFKSRLIVEADGSQHAESAADQARDDWLSAQGFRVLRFWNNDILNNTDGVAEAVLAALEIPLPNPSPVKGEGLDFSSSLAGEEGARARQRVGRRGGE